MLPDAAWDAELAAIDSMATTEPAPVTDELFLESDTDLWGGEPPWEVESAPNLDAGTEAWSPPVVESPLSEPLGPDMEPLAEAGETPATANAGVEDAFEEWFSGNEPAAVVPRASAVEQHAPAEPLEAESTSSEDGVGAAGPEDDSDDDLEMFRSWLQSLKR
jgi:hypothetical protein